MVWSCRKGGLRGADCDAGRLSLERKTRVDEALPSVLPQLGRCPVELWESRVEVANGEQGTVFERQQAGDEFYGSAACTQVTEVALGRSDGDSPVRFQYFPDGQRF